MKKVKVTEEHLELIDSEILNILPAKITHYIKETSDSGLIYHNFLTDIGVWFFMCNTDDEFNIIGNEDYYYASHFEGEINLFQSEEGLKVISEYNKYAMDYDEFYVPYADVIRFNAFYTKYKLNEFLK